MRIVNWGGIRLYQIRLFGLVVSLYKNYHWSNCDVDGWHFEITKEVSK